MAAVLKIVFISGLVSVTARAMLDTLLPETLACSLPPQQSLPLERSQRYLLSTTVRLIMGDAIKSATMMAHRSRTAHVTLATLHLDPIAALSIIARPGMVAVTKIAFTTDPGFRIVLATLDTI